LLALSPKTIKKNFLCQGVSLFWLCPTNRGDPALKSANEYGGLREGAKLGPEGPPLTASAIGCLRFWPKGVLVRPCMGDKETKIMGHP